MFLSILFSTSALFALLIFPQDCAGSARAALRIWCLDVVPSLFPYMVFSRILAQRLQRLNAPAMVCVPLLGLLGGSPSGAGLISAYGAFLHPRELLFLSALTGTVSPMFFTGTLSIWLQSKDSGLLLVLCHLLSAMLTGILVYAFAGRETRILSCYESGKTSKSSNPIGESISAVFNVGGYIVVFSVLSGVIHQLPHISDPVASILHALLEVAGGSHAWINADAPRFLRFVLLSGALGFSGLSILYQNYSALHPLGITMKHLLSFALLRSVFAALLAACFYSLSIA